MRVLWLGPDQTGQTQNPAKELRLSRSFTSEEWGLSHYLVMSSLLGSSTVLSPHMSYLLISAAAISAIGKARLSERIISFFCWRTMYLIRIIISQQGTWHYRLFWENYKYQIYLLRDTELVFNGKFFLWYFSIQPKGRLEIRMKDRFVNPNISTRQPPRQMRWWVRCTLQGRVDIINTESWQGTTPKKPKNFWIPEDF